MAGFTYEDAMTALRAADASGNAEDASRLAQIASGLKQSAAQTEPSISDRASHLARLGGHAIASGVLGPSVLLGEGLNQAYNFGAKGINAVAGMDIQPRTSVRSGFETFLGNAGLEPPANTPERFAHAAGSALTGVGTQLGLVNAARTIPATASELVKNTLLQQPVRQAVAAATGATAGQGVAEAGGGPVAQMAASVAGGALPFARQTVFPTSVNRRPELDLIERARAEGLKLPPTHMGAGPIARSAEGLSGKEALAQQISVQNQARMDSLARRVLKVGEDTALTPELLASKRVTSGLVYEEVKNAGMGGTKHINIDRQYLDTVDNLGGKGYQALKRDFPGLAKGDIENLQASLRTVSPTTEGIVEAVKELRYKASQNYRAVDSSGNPAQRGLAQAQREAANSLEDLIDRTMLRWGRGDLIPKLKQARQDIAITHSIEDALDARGHMIAKNLDPKAPLSPELRLASDFSRSFTKANQNIDKMPSPTPFNRLDFLHAGLWGGAGYYAHPGYGALAAGIPLAQPAARFGLQSILGQYLTSPPSSILTGPQAGSLAAIAAARAQQP